ncbi:glutamate racemase [Pseudoalteromonas sp. S1727]|uniref:glutamate racemase n=1 Tax=Pseudoalteromonas sp. S1727 TaxID=2066514 RepID=UPI001109C69C|nr:glutamate racemase [Pseudoalteromonas sp. S1727]TMN71092.1 glutamate racemase [Pseudoalteromonas sp. S1727]
MSAHILVFDSGLGGTTVLEHIRCALPEVQFSYFMDNAYLPYGKQSQQTIINRLSALLDYITVNQLAVDILVIACNTASTAALSAVRKLASIPIVGVVPAIKPATLITQSKHIALLATPATVQSAYTQQLIQEYAKDVTVHLYASVELVNIAEQAYLNKQLDQNKLTAELDRLAIDHSVDVIVLGCTHFPLLTHGINDYFAGAVRLLDSGAAIAKRVVTLLATEKRPEVAVDKKKPLHFYATASIYIDKQPVELVTLTDLTQNEKS